MENNTSDYLVSYQNFFKNVAANFNNNDPLPVTTSYHSLEEYEINGQVYEWCHRYLSARDCPEDLMMLLCRTTLDEISTICKTDPVRCGYVADTQSYMSYTLSLLVIRKLNEICSRYSDNALLSSLPPPSLKILPVDYHGDRNLRPYMEDLHAVVHDLNAMYNIQGHGRAGFYAIYDGHLGVRAAQYCVIHLHQYLAESEHYPDNPVEALKEAFEKTDDHFLHKKLKGGTTAVCLLHMVDKKKIYLAWVGDSEAALAKAGRGIHLVKPHKADIPEEKKRIEDRGGAVMYYKGVWRVGGGLAITRAIGDQPYKSLVTAEADVVEMDVTDDMDFVVLGSDGFWVVDTPEIIWMVYQHLKENKDLKGISKALCNVAAKDSQDNISALVVLLKEKESMDLSVQRPWEGNNEILVSDRDIALQGSERVWVPPKKLAETQEEWLKTLPWSYAEVVKKPKKVPPPPPTPPPKDESQDVGEESESEEEWDYIRGGGNNKTENKDETASDMESQLNPNAAEFVPGFSLDSDVTLSASPCKGSEKSLENIIVPPEKDFDKEISTRPSDLDDSFSILQNGANTAEEIADASTKAVCGDDSNFSASSLTNGHNDDEEDDEERGSNPFMDNEDVNDVLSSPTTVEFVQDHFGKPDLGFKPFEPMTPPINENKEDTSDSNIPISLSAEISSHFNFIDSHLEASETQLDTSDGSAETSHKPPNFNFGNQLDFDEILQSKSNYTSEDKVFNEFSSKESTANISNDVFGSVEDGNKFEFTHSDNAEKLEEQKEEVEKSMNPFTVDNFECKSDIQINEDFQDDLRETANDKEIVNEVTSDNPFHYSEETSVDQEQNMEEPVIESTLDSPILDLPSSVNKIEEDARESEIVNKMDSSDIFDTKTDFITSENDIMTTSYHESYGSRDFDMPVQDTTQSVNFIKDLEFSENIPESSQLEGLEGDKMSENNFCGTEGDEKNILSDKELLVGDEKYFMDKEDIRSPEEKELNEVSSLINHPSEEIGTDKNLDVEENVNAPDEYQLTDHDSSFEVIHESSIKELSNEKENVDEPSLVKESYDSEKLLNVNEDISTVESELVSEQIVVEEKPTVVEETKTVVEETPTLIEETSTVIEEKPTVLEETPFVDEIPFTEEKLITNEATVAEESQLIKEETPVVEEKPMLDEVPIVEEAKFVEETPIPVINDKLIVDEPIKIEHESIPAPEEVADVPSAPSEEPVCNGFHDSKQESSPINDNLAVAAAVTAAVATTAAVGAVAANKASPKKLDAKSPAVGKASPKAPAAKPTAAPGKRPVSATKPSAAASKSPATAASKAPASKTTASAASKAPAPPAKPTTLNTTKTTKPPLTNGKATSPVKPPVSKTAPARPGTATKTVGAAKPAAKPLASTAKPKPTEGTSVAKSVPSATSARPPSAKSATSAAPKPAPAKPLVSKTAPPSAPKPASSTAIKKPTAAPPSRPTTANRPPTATKTAPKPPAPTAVKVSSSTAPKPAAKPAPAAAKSKPAAPPSTKPAPIKAKAPVSAVSKDKAAGGIKKSTVAEKNSKNEIKSVKKPVPKDVDNKVENAAPKQIIDETPEPVTSTTNGHIVDLNHETILSTQECPATVV